MRYPAGGAIRRGHGERIRPLPLNVAPIHKGAEAEKEERSGGGGEGQGRE